LGYKKWTYVHVWARQAAGRNRGRKKKGRKWRPQADSMAKIKQTGRVRLFTLEMGAAAQNCEKFAKNPSFA